MRYLLLSLFLLAAWAGEAEPAKLPTDVQAILDKSATAEAAAQAKADAEITRIKQALIKDLTKLQEAYTKKGNLDAAMGIKAEIDKNQNAINDKLNILGDATAKNMWKTPWKNLQGKVYNVPSVGSITITIEKPSVIIPNPDSRWGGGGSRGGVLCSWQGYANTGSGWMSLQAKVDGKTIDLQTPIHGRVVLFAEDENPDGNTGSVDVKVIPLP